MLSHRGQTDTSIMIRSMTRGLTAAALAAALCVVGTAAASAQEDQSPLSAIGRMFGKKQQTTGQEETEGPTTEQVLRIERLEARSSNCSTATSSSRISFAAGPRAPSRRNRRRWSARRSKVSP
jgi:hypothetical protein